MNPCLFALGLAIGLVAQGLLWYIIFPGKRR
jgi:hypothetical protein